MSNNKALTEPHGCLVCGRTYDLLVVRSPDGRLVDCTVTTPGGRRVPDSHRPLVACTRHSQAEVDAAYAQRYPGGERAEDKERDDD